MTAVTADEFHALVASAVHDAKNHLGIALDQLDVLEGLHEDEPTRRASAGARAALTHLNARLVSVLRLYRLEQNRYPMNIAEHLVADVLDEVRVRYAPLAESNGIALQTECADSLVAVFDENLVAGVLGDAVHNALRNAHTAVRLRAEPENGGILLAVEDDGPGYPEQMLHAPQTAPLGPGSSTGLGLRLARIVARLHERAGRPGRVELDNGGPAGGARLCLHLP